MEKLEIQCTKKWILGVISASIWENTEITGEKKLNRFRHMHSSSNIFHYFINWEFWWLMLMWGFLHHSLVNISFLTHFARKARSNSHSSHPNVLFWKLWRMSGRVRIFIRSSLSYNQRTHLYALKKIITGSFDGSPAEKFCNTLFHILFEVILSFLLTAELFISIQQMSEQLFVHCEYRKVQMSPTAT